jgi:hypothetical protein
MALGRGRCRGNSDGRLAHVACSPFIRYTDAVGARICVVSFCDPDGIRHSVEVSAASLFEAAALALKEFRTSSLADAAKPALATRLVVTVKAPGTEHELTVQQLERWVNGGAKSPKEAALKASLRGVFER